jgi:hypothetical protein
MRAAGGSDGFWRVSDPADPQDADELLSVVDDVRQRDPVGDMMFEKDKTSEGSCAVPGWPGGNPADEDIVDDSSFVRCESFEIGPAVFAVNDRLCHAVWRRRLSQ